MFDLTLAELASLLRDRKVSSEELTRLFLGRIARLDPGLNAFITVDEEKALAAARAADARLGAGAATPLTGIPIAHKDLFCAKGWRTTCGSKMLANFISPYDAHVVEEFDRAGAVLVGKTNMDEFAMGSSNETSFFGPARNPWDPSRVPGGSSGGSAAAVAARLVAAATGTDTGGSIRQPASHTGTSGIRPTYGAVSRYGMVAFASSLDQGGAIGKCADDLARMLNVMAGFDARDSTSVDRPREDYARDLARPLAGIRVGVPKEYFTPELAPDVAACVSRAVEELQTQGATAVEVSLPNQALAVPVYYVIAPAEASSNLARYDGVRFGHRAADGADLFELYCKSRAQGFGAEVQRRILVGTYVLSHGYYDAYYLQAQKVRRLIARDFLEAFKSCDVLAGPAAPSVAFALGEKTNDPVQMYLEDLYTISVNLAGLPALAVPCGFGEGGLPVGLQLIGNYFCEARLLNIAHQYQQATDWHRRCPPGVAP